MKREMYDEIVRYLSKFNTREEKIEYLIKNIEETDYDNNGFNDMLIETLNDLNSKKH